MIEPMEDYGGVAPGDTYDVEIEKRADSLTLRLYDPETRELLNECTWDTKNIAEEIEPQLIQKGRIGLRHMSTKQFIYKDFKVKQL
jgi:DNA-binding TFAR19-related protein (PDSD5 family)